MWRIGLVVLVVVAACGKDDKGGSSSSLGPVVKKSEADIQLAKLAKQLKVAFAEKSSYPIAAIPLTPAVSCCKGEGYKCKADPAAWSAWAPLDFAISEPHYFRYSYESDGKTYVVKAVADLDCDDVEQTYVMQGTAESGTPVETLTKPKEMD